MAQEKQQIVNEVKKNYGKDHKEARDNKKAKIGNFMGENRRKVEGDEHLLEPEKISDADEAVKTTIKTKIFAINKISEINERTMRAFKSTLSEIDTLLKPLEKKYSNDQNLKWYRAMYEDLKDDLDKGSKPKLDSSLDKLVVDMDAEIKKSGVHEVSLDDPHFAGVVGKLRACGIEPGKIVVKGSPSAKTVICLLNIHSRSFMDDYSEKKLKGDSSFEEDPRMEYYLKEVIKSQKKIYDSVESAYKAGLVKQIYLEGRKAGEDVAEGFFKGMSDPQIDIMREAFKTGKFSNEMIDAMEKEEEKRRGKNFSAQEKKELKAKQEGIEDVTRDFHNYLNLHAEDKIPSLLGGLKVGGMEDSLLHASIEDKLKTLDYNRSNNVDKNSEYMEYRSGAHNLFLADNVADQVKKGNEDIVFITLGRHHEDENHSSLPFSRILAYEGVNVIVVK